MLWILPVTKAALPLVRKAESTLRPRSYSGKHYLRFTVGNPSAIGPITTVLERNGVSVARAAAVWAKGESAQHQVRVLTHASLRNAIDCALRDLALLGTETGKNIRSERSRLIRSLVAICDVLLPRALNWRFESR